MAVVTRMSLPQLRTRHDMLGTDVSATVYSRFVTIAVLKSRHQTPVVKKNLNPVFASKDATFDFPLYASLADKLGAIELVVWDKDRFTKADYLGEVALALDDWFVDRNSPDGEVRAYGFEEDGNNVRRAVLRLYAL